jgi:hypothetical protein
MVGGFSVRWPHFLGEDGSWDLFVSFNGGYRERAGGKREREYGIAEGDIGLWREGNIDLKVQEYTTPEKYL